MVHLILRNKEKQDIYDLGLLVALKRLAIHRFTKDKNT
jgi:hypothetical protein